MEGVMVLVMVGESSLIWRRGLQTVRCNMLYPDWSYCLIPSPEVQIQRLGNGNRAGLVILLHFQFRGSDSEGTGLGWSC